MTLTINVEDKSIANEIINFLNNFKNKIDVETLDIETISKDDEDYKYVLEAREARKNGEKLYSLDEVIKEMIW